MRLGRVRAQAIARSTLAETGRVKESGSAVPMGSFSRPNARVVWAAMLNLLFVFGLVFGIVVVVLVVAGVVSAVVTGVGWLNAAILDARVDKL